MIFCNFRQFHVKSYVLSFPEEGDRQTHKGIISFELSPLAKCMRTRRLLQVGTLHRRHRQGFSSYLFWPDSLPHWTCTNMPLLHKSMDSARQPLSDLALPCLNSPPPSIRTVGIKNNIIQMPFWRRINGSRLEKNYRRGTEKIRTLWAITSPRQLSFHTPCAMTGSGGFLASQ